MIEDDFESLPQTASPTSHMLAGALAGIAEHTATYPFDSIKTRMQVLRPHPSAVYDGVIHAYKTICTSEGVLKLYRGIGSVILGAGPAHALYFATYEYAKKTLVRGQAAENPIGVGLAGALATATADGFMTPFDVVKQRMQVHNSSYRGILHCAKDLLKYEGVSGFFVSYPATLVLNVPFHMIQFPVYETFRSFLSKMFSSQKNDYSPLTHIISGGIAGGMAAFFTTPIDVVKTTLQTRNLFGGPVTVIGTREAINLIIKERGWKGFWSGATPRALTFVPGTALCWFVYEYFKWSLSKA